MKRKRNETETKRNDGPFQFHLHRSFLMRMRERDCLVFLIAMSLSKFRRDGSSSSSSDSDLERLLSKIKRPRVRKRLFRPSVYITVSDSESSDGAAAPDFGPHQKTAKDKVIKLLVVKNDISCSYFMQFG